jgi:hypothetical protein
MTKRIIIESCDHCPYCEQTDGQYQVWVCNHRDYKAPINYRSFRCLEKKGGYPQGISPFCPLKDLED